MTVAQTKAARRKFRQYYRNDMPIGTPHYKQGVSAEISSRREAAYRERQRKMAARGKKK
jgi:hypothetical protein